jgi:phage gpG-like protein
MAKKEFRDPNELIQNLFKELYHLEETLLETIGEEGRNILSLLFKSEGRYLGVNWKPLKPEYLRWKIKEGFSEKKLHKTTTLSRSFTYKIEDHKVVIGTNVKSDRNGFPYSVAMEFGTRRGVPARPFMAPTKEELEKRLPAIADRVFKEIFGEG